MDHLLKRVCGSLGPISTSKTKLVELTTQISLKTLLLPTHTGNMFAILSGTSMSTPHVAGIAALIKQHNPSWTPSMIASAISTTSSKCDNLGEPIMAEGYHVNSLLPATPFDYGSGFVNPNRAVDPGLVLPSGT